MPAKFSGIKINAGDVHAFYAPWAVAMVIHSSAQQVKYLKMFWMIFVRSNMRVQRMVWLWTLLREKWTSPRQNLFGRDA
ncbi:MAG: hypothetical protein CM1200mP18_18640 [Gammaproteobacteria bacterium]|nr:MAG: hypothetical protein CM1200mP18_18640 [Gammaproteobacteria bacterium]